MQHMTLASKSWSKWPQVVILVYDNISMNDALMKVNKINKNGHVAIDKQWLVGLIREKNTK